MMRRKSLVSILFVTAGLVGILTPQAFSTPTPLVEFLFDGNFNNTGSLGGSATAQEMNGAMAVIGEGIAGVGKGFDNTSAASMGGNGGLTTFDPGTALNGLKSFTVTGWFKSSQVLDNSASIVYLPAPFNVWGSDTGRMGVTVRDSGGSNHSSGWTGYNHTNQWVFFAVTYDGTSSTDNLTYYVGNTNASSAMTTNVTTLDAGTLSNKLAALRIGASTSNGGKSFDGLLDELRFFGSSSSADGALSSQDVASVRLQDISTIPEPMTLSLLFGGSLLLVRVRSKR